MKNATYKDDFKRLSEKVEKKYDISSWVASLIGRGGPLPYQCESSLNVEKTLENSMLSRINAIGTLKERHNLITSESGLISRMSSHFWSIEDEIVIWKALDLTRKVITETDRASSEIEKAKSVIK